MVGGFVWVQLFELVRTCFGCFGFFLDCSGLGWAVVVAISCSSCLMLYKVAVVFQRCFLVESPTWIEISVILILVVFNRVHASLLSFDDVFGVFGLVRLYWIVLYNCGWFTLFHVFVNVVEIFQVVWIVPVVLAVFYVFCLFLALLQDWLILF